MILQTWGEVLSASFKNIWFGMASFVPNLIFAIVIILVGWMVSSLIEKFIARIISAAKLDGVLASAGLKDLLNKAGFTLNSGAFIGGLVKWYLIVVFLVASFEVLGLSQVNQFLQGVVLQYIPNVIAAALILLAAVVVAEIVQKLVVGTAKASGFKNASFLGAVVRWAIWIFALIMVLVQLGIAVAFLNTLFTGVVVAIALALGLSFGLGGQDAAARYIEKIKNEVSNR